MRIVHWDEAFHPNFGYQINLLSAYQKKAGNEVIILAADNTSMHPAFASFAEAADTYVADRKFEERTGVKVIRLPVYGVISGRTIYKPGFIRVINNIRPDVLMCHTSDTLSAMTILWNHRRIHAPLVFDNHMLEMASANPMRNAFRWFYTHFVTPVMKKNRFITIRTQDDPYVMKCLGIPEELAPYISFGTDTDLFHPDGKQRAEFRKEAGISENAFVVLYAGKLTAAKGGLLLAQALEKKLTERREVVAIVIGNTNKDDYGRQVEETLSRSEHRILRFGTQNYRDLAKFYQAADLALFAKQCSLSFFDVQACGLPVVMEDSQVNIDRVQAGNGFTFQAGDLEDFTRHIRQCIEMQDEEYSRMKQASVNYIMQNFDYTDIARQYTDILEREMRRQNGTV